MLPLLNQNYYNSWFGIYRDGRYLSKVLGGTLDRSRLVDARENQRKLIGRLGSSFSGGIQLERG
jgi:hypothetical protein